MAQLLMEKARRAARTIRRDRDLVDPLDFNDRDTDEEQDSDFSYLINSKRFEDEELEDPLNPSTTDEETIEDSKEDDLVDPLQTDFNDDDESDEDDDSADDSFDQQDDEESNEEDRDDLDDVVDTALEDPRKQGVLKTVPGARLVSKVKEEDDSYTELWMYVVSRFKEGFKIRSRILSGTDIPPNQLTSEDGSQTYSSWTVGNIEMLEIKGLPH